MKRSMFIAFVLASMLLLPSPALSEEGDEQPKLSYTRLLQRVQLRLLGRSPTMAEYEAVLNAADDAAREAMIDDAIETGLKSKAFYDEMVLFGYEYLRVKRYGMDIAWPPWKNAVQLYPCPANSLHAGRFGSINYNEGMSDSRFICDGNAGQCDTNNDNYCRYGFTCDGADPPICQPNACTEDKDCGAEFRCDVDAGVCKVILSERAPWWAPNTTVKLIGWAGEGHTSAPNKVDAETLEPTGPLFDCGVVIMGTKGGNTSTQYPHDVTFKANYAIRPRCGCGPNLIYCGRGVAGGNKKDLAEGLITVHDGYENDPNGKQSSIFQEPARLFAHIIVNDRSFDDLITADYTVVNQPLQHFYIRTARQTGRFQELDNNTWWQDIQDPNEWREVIVEDINPFYLKARDTKFDPRIDPGEPPGIPSAGVLTTLGASGAFLRERPRAARWLESLACREFVPPPSDAVFPPFNGDPGSSGTCYHCHVNMDPAAIHFKRFALMGAYGIGGQGIGGISPYRWKDGADYYFNRVWSRWEGEYAPYTKMTPVTDDDIAFNPDARFIDFAPPGTTLFGVESDGTIGPLGFAKMLIESGKFDRCTVRRFYQRFMGLKLHPAKHKLYIDKLVKVYIEKGKQIRPFIKWMMKQARFRQGH